LPVSRHLPHPANQASSSSCQRLTVLLRDWMTVTPAKTIISSRSFAPSSKREDHVVLSACLSSTEGLPRIPQASCETPCTDSLIVELSGTIRLLRQTASGRQKAR
jgi:hypothetical protein